MTTFVWTVLGTMCVCLGMYELYMAVLYPRAASGPVTTLINLLFRVSVLRVTRLRNACGPLLIVTQICCWATLLWLGLALISWPRLGEQIITSGQRPAETDFATAMYYAGFTLTTLGTGDLVPDTVGMKIVMVCSAGLGFSYFTLVLAYVVSVYDTLAKRNRFASEIDYRTQRTGDPLRYLVPRLRQGDRSSLDQDLTQLSAGLAELLESHHLYPALHYFRFSSPRYAMVRMLYFCLETATLLRLLQELESARSRIPHEATERLWHAGLQMCDETVEHFAAGQPSDPDDEASQNRFKELRQPLQSCAMEELSKDAMADQLTNRYIQMRRQWFGQLQALERSQFATEGLKHSEEESGRNK